MIELTEASEADMESLVELLHILFEQEVEHHPNAKAQEEGLRMILTHPEIGKIFVVKAENRCVGMVSLLFTISTALGGKVAWLEDMVIHPNYRQMNYGSKLLEYVLMRAKELTCKRITLLTDVDNAVAHHFYERFGFERSSMCAYKLFV